STVSRHQLGIAGSINALVRNMGMVCGIALATTLLYGSMSGELGYRVTDYV
ncbi:MAG TPA: MFS transporter, partial [Acetobacterium sp.]|nr:MFS transporter [Acetobacterium sp.]